MLTTHSPMSESNTTSIIYTTSATTSPTTTGTAVPTNKGNQNNLVLTTCELQAEIGGHGHPCPRTTVSALVRRHGQLKNQDRGHGHATF